MTLGLARFTLSRPFRFPPNLSVERQIDTFNLTDGDVIVGMADAVGVGLSHSNQIPARRIVRAGFVVNFRTTRVSRRAS